MRISASLLQPPPVGNATLKVQIRKVNKLASQSERCLNDFGEGEQDVGENEDWYADVFDQITVHLEPAHHSHRAGATRSTARI